MTTSSQSPDEIRAELEATARAHAESRGNREATLLELRTSVKAMLVAIRRMRGRETRLHGQKLSYAQFGLLHAMSEESCQSARDLAQHADLSPGTVTQMLDSLEALGLVERSRSTEDKRIVLSELTDRGHEMMAARKEQMESRWNEALAGFDDEELHAAAGVLGSLAAYFNDLD
jgi:DNA-binding MarR family transcriptional regulator